MHQYREFVQAELDARGWKQSDLARRSGLHRSLISKILNDDRPHLGQMPDDTTIDGIAKGFGIPAERVRQAAARALDGYAESSGGDPLDSYSTDYLLDVIRRRMTPADNLPMAARTSDEPKPE
jgi:transcriptional regulator with XRE-family HTH domain